VSKLLRGPIVRTQIQTWTGPSNTPACVWACACARGSCLT